MVRRFIPLFLLSILAVFPAIFMVETASAATCVNKFVSRRERLSAVVTLLTGKLTFQEAQELAKNINDRKSPPLEWVDDSGKTVAKQFGELKVVRPMPVGCDGKTSGVVMIANFVTQNTPAKKMSVKLDANTTVVFEEQAQ
jgi:hypothetical protein